MKKSAYLVGPFIGTLQWEYMYFAPYIINLMKNDPSKKFVVFTRSSRFDLYGSYADIFVPLKISYDRNHLQEGFTIKGFKQKDYESLMRAFIQKYKKRFKIVRKIIYPEISQFSYKVKWQFPKKEMDYDFNPRRVNKDIADKFVDGYNVFVNSSTDNISKNLEVGEYKVKYSNEYINQVRDFVNDGRLSILGCFIEALKKVDFVVGNMSSDIARLAILLKKPVITINEQLTDDEISLINPFKIPIIKCDDIKKGLEVYEDNFRFKECGVRE